MKKIKWRLETGIVGHDHKGEVEIEDDATDDEIEAAVQADMWNYVSLSWEKAT